MFIEVHIMKLIKRTKYLNELRSLMHTPDIKVITGVRRSGKSKLLEAFIEKIKKIDATANIIHINFNISDFAHLLDCALLEAYIEECFEKGKNNYVLIDEIQMCKNFEIAINSLHAREKYDIYITGSNAFLQSSDLATLFVGRAYEVHVFPFSFSEYLEYFPSNNIYESFSKYITEGGMAGSYLYTKVEQKYRYLNNEVLNALIVRDIVANNKIRNIPLLQELIDFLMDNIGNITSVNSIAKFLSKNNVKVDHKTVGNYIGYLCKAYAFYRIRRYDIMGKKYLQSKDKYYLSDHSFKYARLGIKNMDYGRMLENIVAIELIRRGYELYVGVMYNSEIDFVAIKQGENCIFKYLMILRKENL